MAFGLALKSASLFLRLLQFLCAAVILAIFSYFLATLHDHGLHINAYVRAVEGISGSGVLYTIFALVLVCFLGGIAFFSVLGMLLDLAFTGAFVYIAWETRKADSCKNNVNTILGSGSIRAGDRADNGIKLKTACRLEQATFIVSIIGAFLFFISVFLELGLMRVHKKDKAFGPSPNNGYTAGSPKRKFWQRKPKNRDVELAAGEKPDALPAHQTPADMRTSYGTESTAVGNEPVANKYGNNPTMTGAVGGPQTTGYTTTTTTQSGGYTPYRSENTTF